jgi:hypothetical protein
MNRLVNKDRTAARNFLAVVRFHLCGGHSRLLSV